MDAERLFRTCRLGFGTWTLLYTSLILSFTQAVARATLLVRLVASARQAGVAEGASSQVPEEHLYGGCVLTASTSS